MSLHTFVYSTRNSANVCKKVNVKRENVKRERERENVSVSVER